MGCLRQATLDAPSRKVVLRRSEVLVGVVVRLLTAPFRNH